MRRSLYCMPDDALVFGRRCPNGGAIWYEYLAEQGRQTREKHARVGKVELQHRAVGEYRPRRELFFEDRGAAWLWAYKRQLLFIPVEFPFEELTAELMLRNSDTGGGIWAAIIEKVEGHGLQPGLAGWEMPMPVEHIDEVVEVSLAATQLTELSEANPFTLTPGVAESNNVKAAQKVARLVEELQESEADND